MSILCNVEHKRVHAMNATTQEFQHTMDPAVQSTPSSTSVSLHQRQDRPDDLGEAGVQPVLRGNGSVLEVHAGGNGDPRKGTDK